LQSRVFLAHSNAKKSLKNWANFLYLISITTGRRHRHIIRTKDWILGLHNTQLFIIMAAKLDYLTFSNLTGCIEPQIFSTCFVKHEYIMIMWSGYQSQCHISQLKYLLPNSFAVITICFSHLKLSELNVKYLQLSYWWHMNIVILCD